MNNNYNANMYLTRSDLNNIENRIESITNEIQEKIFNNTSSPLRTIRVGDNLNTKTLYFSFPTDLYEDISGDGTDVFTTNENNYIDFIKQDLTVTNRYLVRLYANDELRFVYNKLGTYAGVISNPIDAKLPYNMGVVNYINSTNSVYNKIKIYEDETIIPNYVKHNWVNNEFLSMQKINNIERGIYNIGKYYYKPNGWVESREWMNPTGLKMQNISYQDLNRWVNNLDLINFDNLENISIWNSSLSQFQWNKYSNVEWEEL